MGPDRPSGLLSFIINPIGNLYKMVINSIISSKYLFLGLFTAAVYSNYLTATQTDSANSVYLPGGDFSGFNYTRGWLDGGANHQSIQTDSATYVYLPGGGFSGFYYTRGWLDGGANDQSITYHCFSAGCLALVSSALHIPIASVFDRAVRIQSDWREGIIHRFEVLPLFVDWLLEHANDSSELSFSNVKILTTEFPFVMRVDSPRTKEELRQRLLETARIPFVLSPVQSLSDLQITDGGFSLVSHLWHLPIDLGVWSLSYKMMRNFLDVGVTIDTCLSIYEEGKKDRIRVMDHMLRLKTKRIGNETNKGG